jgi:hypothetical protein
METRIMIEQPIEAALPPHPTSKWTAAVQARFLEHLSRKGNVRAACLLVGASAETAYRLRRRDPAFARGWDAAIALARRAAEHVLADRAIDGVVVDIYHRGEWIASQRKYDSRLLLAHLARLDQQVKAAAEADAERFDEILGAILGEPIPAAFESADDELLGTDRERFAEEAARAARDEAEAAAVQAQGEAGETLSGEEREARFDAHEAACADAEACARAEARWQWDMRHRELCAAVDAALEVPADEEEADAAEPAPDGENGQPEAARGGGEDISPRTPSTPSTPPLAEGGGETQKAAPRDGLSGPDPEDPPRFAQRNGEVADAAGG